MEKSQQGKQSAIAFHDFHMCLTVECKLDRDGHDITAWISTLNFAAKQNDFFSRHEEGTGEWLFQTDTFKNWLGGAETTLWCPGIREIS